MSYSIYESINHSSASFVNAFVAPIESSAFHWHAEYELIGILKGSVTVRVQSEMIRMKAKDVLLINPNVIHAIQGVEGEDNLCMVIQMQPNLFWLDEGDVTDLRFYLDSTSDEVPRCGFAYFYQRMANIIYAAMSDEKYAPFRVRAHACSLIADLFDYVVYDVRFRDIKTKDDQQLVASIIDFLENHLEEEKIVDLTCHEFGLSRKTLDRSLKATIGVTGKEIIDNLRMEKAKNLLKNTTKNMNYILDSCGFGSEKTFYRVFRQETGLTPKEFRQKGQIMNRDGGLKGYLDFETFEVKDILRKIIQTPGEGEMLHE